MHTEKSFGKQDAKELGGEKKKKVTTTKKKPPKQTARICDRISWYKLITQHRAGTTEKEQSAAKKMLLHEVHTT